jgi:hypothetical protein
MSKTILLDSVQRGEFRSRFRFQIRVELTLLRAFEYFWAPLVPSPSTARRDQIQPKLSLQGLQLRMECNFEDIEIAFSRPDRAHPSESNGRFYVLRRL